MGSFQTAFDKIGDALEDLATLDVISYKGTIELTATGPAPDFDALLAKARGSAQFKLVACTQAKLDGDVTVFYDKDATEADLAAHNQLVSSATEKRAAIIKIFETAIIGAIKK